MIPPSRLFAGVVVSIKEFRVSLPLLFPAQARIVNDSRRFNVVAGGRDAGKTTLAIDLLLASRLGALHGHAVAVVVPDAATLLRVQRRLLAVIHPLVSFGARRGNQSSRGIWRLVGGGTILMTLAAGLELEAWEPVSLLVVLDAAAIPDLVELWDQTLQMRLTPRHGQAWFFSIPRGGQQGFHDLYQRAQIDSGDHRIDWAAFCLPSAANPHGDRLRLAHDQRTMSPEVFRQEREARFLEHAISLTAAQAIIGQHETFRQWCQRLAQGGLKVDNHPFTIDDRPAMHFIYDLIPCNREAAFEKTIVLMKCAQVGFTVMEILAMLYLAFKFTPAKIGMYLPDQNLARIKSSERFMPIVRTVPEVYRLMLAGDGEHGKANARSVGEGNVMIRNIGGSRFHFLWTSGKGATESVPLDALALDEVQEMQVADMEKVAERLSASRLKFTLAGSTANWPDRDIHFLWKRGTRHQFWTRCPHCHTSHVLDEYFPECIQYDAERRDYRYVCRSCHGWIDDPQQGKWRAQDPDARVTSLHFPQFLSPTITPRNIIEAYFNADDMKNFYNRKLGKPYVDPSQVPVNLEMLNTCAEEGLRLGVAWKTRAAGCFMGIDQMGAFNVAIVAERLSSGHMAVVHVEEIYSDDPFARCDQLMANYGVDVCVVETLPNYNDAKRFANRHLGRVFLAGYAELQDDMLRWGDTPMSRKDRKIAEQDRDRYTVTLDQYKCMQVALARIQDKTTVFPDPDGLVQELCEKGLQSARRPMAILRERVFLHLTRTALVADKDPEQNKYRRKVVKVGIDPHFSYAYMLLNVAWARAHGHTRFLLPESTHNNSTQAGLPGAAAMSPVVQIVREQHQILRTETCGVCCAFEGGQCAERSLHVNPTDPGCVLFVGNGDY